MTTIQNVPDGSELDNGFSAFLAAQAAEILGEEVEVETLPRGAIPRADEHAGLVNRIWDRWCGMSDDARAEWAD